MNWIPREINPCEISHICSCNLKICAQMHYSNVNSSVTWNLKEKLFCTRDTERPSDSDKKNDVVCKSICFLMHISFQKLKILRQTEAYLRPFQRCMIELFAKTVNDLSYPLAIFRWKIINLCEGLKYFCGSHSSESSALKPQISKYSSYLCIHHIYDYLSNLLPSLWKNTC